ncbi:MAG: hypothetical protein ABIA11_03800 [Patescibacteria group bacterium]|nr:hypothetical protein [Patescibacteria group bacterium]
MKFFREFFERNKPVFTIGLITFFVFAVIILISSTKKSENSDLIRLKDEDTRIIFEEEDTPPNTPSSTEESENEIISDGSEPNPEVPSFDERIGIVEIKYYEKWGFVPKNLSALNGQLVRWTNTTENDVTFTQKMPTYPELQDPIIIKPNETFEFRLYEEGLWTYEEGATKNFGSIDVKPNLIP